MRDSTPASVRSTVAAYFDVDPTQVKPEQQLQNHWGLGPLGLKRLASRIGQVERVGIRALDLEGVQTVGQLINLVRRLRHPVPIGTFSFQHV
jgi:acyl carrier protein